MRFDKEGFFKRKNVTKLFLIIMLSCAVAGLFEVFSNFGVLFCGERGTYPVVSERTYFKEDGEGIRFSPSLKYVGKLVISYGGEMILYEEDAKSGETREFPFPANMQSIRFRLGLKFSGDEDFTYFYDNQPAYLSTEVFNVARLSGNGGFGNREIEEIKIDIEEAPVGAEGLSERTDLTGLYISSISVKNLPEFNPYRAFSVFALSLLIMFFTAYFRFFRKNVHAAFFLSCMLLGTALLTCLPSNKVGNDEETHFRAVIDMASFPGKLHVSDQIVNQLRVTSYNNPEAQPGTIEEKAEYDDFLNDACNYKTGDLSPDYYTPLNRTPAYLSQAAGVKLAKGLSLDWTQLMLMGRFMNLLFYALLMTAAIRKLPCGKYLMYAIGLFPQNLFLAATFSYDPFVTACLSLGTAYLFRELLNGEKKINVKNIVIMAAAFFMGCIPKAVYAPMLLTAYMLPSEKFSSKRNAWLYRAFVTALFLLLIAAFILPTAVAPSETGDLRGGETSEVSQVGYILENPLSYAFVLIREIIRGLPMSFFSADATTFMGHLVTSESEFKGYYGIVLFLFVFCVAADRENLLKRILSVKEKLWIFLMAGASCALIWTSMYVAFTEPGAETIAGVQGRYFIPLFFPLYSILNQRKRKAEDKIYPEKTRFFGVLASKNDICYYLIMVLCAAAAFMCIWSSAAARLCL